MPYLSSGRTKNGAGARSRQALAIAHLYLVRQIAVRMRETLPAHVELDDLIGAGMIGLLDAVHRFDSEKNTSFPTYAKHRIRGAIADSLRALDPLSRDSRRKHREAERVSHELTSQLRREPTEEEIAKCLSLSLDRWRRLARELFEAGCPINGQGFTDHPVVLTENLSAKHGDPAVWAVRAELRETLGRAIRALPARSQEVIRLYYGCEWTMQQIGIRLGVNESRVSQIHSAAIMRLRRHLVEGGHSRCALV